MNKIFALLLLITLLVLNTGTVNAQYLAPQKAQPISKLEVKKFVKTPQLTKGAAQEYKESAEAQNQRFSPSSEVEFKIEVKNTGQTELNNIQVRDPLPQYLVFISGPGNFDQKTNTLNITVDKLRPGESVVREFKAKFKGNADLPAGVTCHSNVAEARVNELFSQGRAVFCVENRVLGVTSELPKTGPAENAIAFVSFGFLLTSLFIFRRLGTL